MTQKQGEGGASFLQQLKDQVNKCEFAALSDDLTLSQFIFGLSDHSVRAKLLALPDLTLQLAIQERLLQETVAVAQQGEAVVTSIEGKSSHSEHFAVSSPKKEFLPNKNKNSLTSSSSAGAICQSCDHNNHRRANCKFRNAICHSCRKVGHISKVCKSARSTASVQQVSDGFQPVSDSIVLSVSSSDLVGKLCYKQFKVGSAHIKFLVDSGSQVTLLPKDLLSRTGLCMSTENIPRIVVYGGSEIVGIVTDVSFSHAGKSHIDRIVVTEESTTPILGMDYLVPLGLLQFQSNPMAYDDHSFVASFRLKKDFRFYGMCYAPRSLPFSMKAIVETEIRRLLREDIIYPVQTPTVLAPIGAKHPIRICGDYSVTLNKVIDPDSYRLPRLEEIMERISGAQVYSVLDLMDAYL